MKRYKYISAVILSGAMVFMNAAKDYGNLNSLTIE